MRLTQRGKRVLVAVVALTAVMVGVSLPVGDMTPPPNPRLTWMSDDGPQDGSTDCWTIEMCERMAEGQG